MLRATIVTVFFYSIVASGVTLAQTPASSAADKAAVSKACSEQATAKNLHGKARKKFRSECKAKGGKM